MGAVREVKKSGTCHRRAGRVPPEAGGVRFGERKSVFFCTIRCLFLYSPLNCIKTVSVRIGKCNRGLRIAKRIRICSLAIARISPI